jgi:hypothetical protein
MAHTLANRLQGFKTRPELGGVDADTLQRTVVHRQEDRCRCLPVLVIVVVMSVPHISSTRSCLDRPVMRFVP